MSKRWAIRMPGDRADAAACVRLARGVEACDSGGEFWLRGHDADEPLEREIRTLPATGRYTVFEDNRITPAGDRVPVGRLPDGPWVPIAERLAPMAPTAALPGELPHAALVVSLVASDEPLASTILITSWDRFFSWAKTAPEARLRPLVFAVAADGRVFLRGTPLPPIAGRHHVEHHGLVLPAGRRLEPAIDPQAALSWLRENGSSRDDLIVFADDASFECVPLALLVPASRRAVRLTEERRLAR